MPHVTFSNYRDSIKFPKEEQALLFPCYFTSAPMTNSFEMATPEKARPMNTLSQLYAIIADHSIWLFLCAKSFTSTAHYH